jgi:iron complex outermembrane receptor protein
MRTLVLMNGRRTTYTPAEGPAGVDTNLLPIAAIGRVEVLKDGAAATYGSDAIAGVVNFITRRDLDGLELSGEFRAIDEADGDWTGSVNWGWVGDDSNVLISYAQQFRSELRGTDRDWSSRPYDVNPTGWSAFGRPGTYRLYDENNALVPAARVHLRPGSPTRTAIRWAGIRSVRRRSRSSPSTTWSDRAATVYGELNTEIAPGVEFIEGCGRKLLPNYRTSRLSADVGPERTRRKPVPRTTTRTARPPCNPRLDALQALDAGRVAGTDRCDRIGQSPLLASPAGVRRSPGATAASSSATNTTWPGSPRV